MQVAAIMSKSEIVQRNNTEKMNNAGLKDSTYKRLIVEERERLLIVKFNRPGVKNALDKLAYCELIRVLQNARFNSNISIIVLTGVGDVFTAGNDLKQSMQSAYNTQQNNQSSNFILRSLANSIIYLDKILVALVNGPCVGIGFTLCALCDIVYCTEKAYFQTPFSKLAICTEMGASYTFPRILGNSKAAELLLFGTKLTAQDAEKYQFVAQIIRSDQLDTLFWPQMQDYSRLPIVSLLASKRLMRFTEKDKLLQVILAEIKELSKLRGTKENILAITSFFNKNKRSKL